MGEYASMSMTMKPVQLMPKFGVLVAWPSVICKQNFILNFTCIPIDFLKIGQIEFEGQKVIFLGEKTPENLST